MSEWGKIETVHRESEADREMRIEMREYEAAIARGEDPIKVRKRFKMYGGNSGTEPSPYGLLWFKRASLERVLVNYDRAEARAEEPAPDEIRAIIDRHRLKLRAEIKIIEEQIAAFEARGDTKLYRFINADL